MCLFPRLIINRKYTGTKKNGGNAPELIDERVRYVSVGCGNCMECRKQKANEWRTRLYEEIQHHKYNYFVTLTFAPEQLEKLCKTYKLNECNAIAGKAVRLFLERVRKEKKTSLKHWLITELGQHNTERIHLHGIIFNDMPITNEWLQEKWQYGESDTGKYCNGRTINYIVKYVTKVDTTHKNFKAQIFCSKGIGSQYINDFAKRKHQYKGTETKEYYTLPDGRKIGLPIYYRNKLFTEEEREKLWINRIELDTRYVNGIKICNVMGGSDKNYKYFLNVLETAQETNKKIGYGDDSNEWKKENYNITLRMLNKKKN